MVYTDSNETNFRGYKMRFELITQENGKYAIVDTVVNKLCAYSGKACNPPKYKGETKCKLHEWNNYHSALGFANKLAEVNAK